LTGAAFVCGTEVNLYAGASNSSGSPRPNRRRSGNEAPARDVFGRIFRITRGSGHHVAGHLGVRHIGRRTLLRPSRRAHLRVAALFNLAGRSRPNSSTSADQLANSAAASLAAMNIEAGAAPWCLRRGGAIRCRSRSGNGSLARSAFGATLKMMAWLQQASSF
jgi:hypothetical protein